MPLTLIAAQGDTLDALLWREACLGIDALPLGARVIVPDLRPAPADLSLIQLWA